jgi:hypothetical protein
VINGGDACHVFWQVTSSATLGTSSVFVGTVLALTSVTATTGAVIFGRLLARNGAVTLDNNQMNRPSCTAATKATPTGPATTAPQPATGAAAATTNPLPGTGIHLAIPMTALLAVVVGGLMLATTQRRRVR